MAVYRFCRQMVQKEPVTLYGDGSMRRDFTYIEDILDGVVKAMEKNEGYAIYNLGESRTISVLELVHLLAQALGVQPQIQFLPEQPGDVRQTYADIRRAQKELGYNPQVPIEEGIQRFVAWFQTEAT